MTTTQLETTAASTITVPTPVGSTGGVTLPEVDGHYTIAGRQAVVDGFTESTVWYSVFQADGETTKHRTTRRAFANPALVQPRS